MGQPRVLLADEPTGNLDSRNAQLVMDLLAALHEQGSTIVMVTHDPRSAERAERARAGSLTVRIYDAGPLRDWKNLAGAGVQAAFGSPVLRIGNLKSFADGALGSTTAWMDAPFPTCRCRLRRRLPTCRRSAELWARLRLNNQLQGAAAPRHTERSHRLRILMQRDGNSRPLQKIKQADAYGTTSFAVPPRFAAVVCCAVDRHYRSRPKAPSQGHDEECMGL